jgi:hypothetical protein
MSLVRTTVSVALPLCQDAINGPEKHPVQEKDHQQNNCNVKKNRAVRHELDGFGKG